MNLHELFPFPEEQRDRKRVGRGSSSGCGCTSGRGNKGQNSRSGGGVRPGFEGGQMPLQRRLPKRGFKNALFRTTFLPLNLDRLLKAIPGQVKISLEDIYAKNLSKKGDLVKILGRGEVHIAVHVEAHRFSVSAAKKIIMAGGEITELMSHD
ncbi:50S ribosomal subunit protein L15 [Desulfovibrionales bacterium]